MVTINPYLGVTKHKGYKTRQVNAYKKEHVRQIPLHLNKKYDRDVIKWLDENKPYQTAIKSLIREKIKQEKAEKRRLQRDSA